MPTVIDTLKEVDFHAEELSLKTSYMRGIMELNVLKPVVLLLELDVGVCRWANSKIT